MSRNGDMWQRKNGLNGLKMALQYGLNMDLQYGLNMAPQYGRVRN